MKRGGAHSCGKDVRIGFMCRVFLVYDALNLFREVLYLYRCVRVDIISGTPKVYPRKNVCRKLSHEVHFHNGFCTSLEFFVL